MSASEQSQLFRERLLEAVALSLHETQGEGPTREDLTEYEQELRDVLKAGALVESMGRIRFFHNTFADYVLARALARSPEKVIDEVLEAPQDLTRRPLLKKMLGFLQRENRAEYTRLVDRFLSDGGIRFHLKDVVYAVMREDAAPEEADLLIVEDALLDDAHLDHNAVWSVVTRPAWFSLMDRTGRVLNWMMSDEESDRDRAQQLLFIAQRSAPDRVSVLLRPFLEISGDWPQRLRSLIRSAPAEESAAYSGLILESLRRGVFDDGVKFDDSAVWMAGHDLPTKQPNRAIELLDAYFIRALELSPPADLFTVGSQLEDEGPFHERDYWPSEFIEACARHSARRFLEVVIPFFATVLDATAEERRGEVKSGDPWSFRHHSDSGRDGLRWALLAALEEALRLVAVSKPRSLPVVAAPLVERRDFETARYLLFRAWSANPERFAGEAVNYIASTPPAFRCGFADSPYWVTRELIASVQPFASPASLKTLEDAVLAYRPSWERGVEGRKEAGGAQYTLLRAFDPEKLSTAGRKKRQELERKFGDRDPRPLGIRAGVVPSPIPDQAARHMSDDDWLSAMEAYSEDENPKDFLAGGAGQLSNVLQQETRMDPLRFARLTARFPDETNPSYVVAILFGLGEAETVLEPDEYYAVLRRFYEMPGRPGGRWLSKITTLFADAEVPDNVLEIVAWHATEDPDPDPTSWARDPETGEWPHDRDPFSVGINSVRGHAAEAVSTLIWPSESRVQFFADTLRKLANDPSAPVRACASLPIFTASKWDEDFAIELFLDLTQTDDAVLNAPFAQRFMIRFGGDRLAELRPIIEQMLTSSQESVRQTGARQAALVALRTDEASDLRDQALAGGPSGREGVADVAAANAFDSQLGERSREWLTQFLNDPDLAVRAKASEWVNGLEPETAADHQGLLEVHIDSPAYTDDEGPLLRALSEATRPLAETALHAVELFMNNRRSEAADVSRAASLNASAASQLAFRAYASASSTAMQERALDVIDALLAARVSDVYELIEEYDSV